MLLLLSCVARRINPEILEWLASWRDRNEVSYSHEMTQPLAIPSSSIICHGIVNKPAPPLVNIGLVTYLEAEHWHFQRVKLPDAVDRLCDCLYLDRSARDTLHQTVLLTASACKCCCLKTNL